MKRPLLAVVVAVMLFGSSPEAEPQGPIYETTRAQLVEQGLWEPYANDPNSYLQRRLGARLRYGISFPKTGGTAREFVFLEPGVYRLERACSQREPRPWFVRWWFQERLTVTWAFYSPDKDLWSREKIGITLNPRFDSRA